MLVVVTGLASDRGATRSTARKSTLATPRFRWATYSRMLVDAVRSRRAIAAVIESLVVRRRRCSTPCSMCGLGALCHVLAVVVTSPGERGDVALLACGHPVACVASSLRVAY